MIGKLGSKMSPLRIFGMVMTGRWNNIQDPEGNLPVPARIGDYTLVEEMDRPAGHRECQFGFYEDSAGNRAVCKQWSGNHKNENYYWLINELNVYKAIDKAIASSPEFSQKWHSVKVPKLLAAAEEPNRAYILIERLDGHGLVDFDYAKRISCFEMAIDYIRDLDEILKRQGYVGMKFRKPWFFASLMPLIAMLAMVRYPKSIFYVLKSLVISTVLLPKFVMGYVGNFVHRDLTVNNTMLLESGQFGIIDFQLSLVTDYMFEVTQIASGSFNKPEFRGQYYQTERMRGILADRTSFLRYIYCSIYTAVHLLATSKGSIQERNFVYLREIIDLYDSRKN